MLSIEVERRVTSPRGVSPTCDTNGEIEVDAKRLVRLLEMDKKWSVDDDVPPSARSDYDDRDVVSLAPKVWRPELSPSPSRVNVSVSQIRGASGSGVSAAVLDARSSLSRNLSSYYSRQQKPPPPRQESSQTSSNQKGEEGGGGEGATAKPRVIAKPSALTPPVPSQSSAVASNPKQQKGGNGTAPSRGSSQPALWALHNLVGSRDLSMKPPAATESRNVKDARNAEDADLLRALSETCDTTSEAASLFYDLREAYMKTRQRFKNE